MREGVGKKEAEARDAYDQRKQLLGSGVAGRDPLAAWLVGGSGLRLWGMWGRSSSPWQSIWGVGGTLPGRTLFLGMRQGPFGFLALPQGTGCCGCHESGPELCDQCLTCLCFSFLIG